MSNTVLNERSCPDRLVQIYSGRCWIAGNTGRAAMVEWIARNIVIIRSKANLKWIAFLRWQPCSEGVVVFARFRYIRTAMKAPEICLTVYNDHPHIFSLRHVSLSSPLSRLRSVDQPISVSSRPHVRKIRYRVRSRILLRVGANDFALSTRSHMDSGS